MVYQKNKIFKCNSCWFETNHSHHLNEHIKMKHTRQSLLKCTWLGCDKEFTEKSLKNHVKYTDKGVRKYKCEKCYYADKQLSYLKDHIKSIHKNNLNN